MQLQIKSFSLCLYGDYIRCVANQNMQVYPGIFELYTSGLNLGEIKNFINNFQQKPGRAAGIVQVALLGLIQPGIPQEFGKTDKTVQWGADLVAHICQELTFGPARCNGCLFGAD